MPRTLLVETLLESMELQKLLDSPPRCAQTVGLKKQTAECGAIVDYLRARFVALNPACSESVAIPTTSRTEHKWSIDVCETESELACMDDLSLLRYGTVLKYVCSAEAELLDQSLDQSLVLLFEARLEWRRRFRGTAIEHSI